MIRHNIGRCGIKLRIEEGWSNDGPTGKYAEHRSLIYENMGEINNKAELTYDQSEQAEANAAVVVAYIISCSSPALSAKHKSTRG
jgi:hypothetical protein